MQDVSAAKLTGFGRVRYLGEGFTGTLPFALLLDYQANRELGSFGLLAFYGQCAAMPSGYNVVGQAQSQPCAFAGGFSGEEGLENFGFHRFGNARAIVAHPNKHLAGLAAGADRDGRVVNRLIWELTGFCAFLNSIKRIIVKIE